MIEVLASAVLIPYISWTVASIFSMRQELALLKQGNVLQKELYDLIKSRLT